MKSISTRDIVHKTKEIREALERGESFEWTQHGRTIGYLQPVPEARQAPEPIDWVARARAVGAVTREDDSVSAALYEDRGA